MSRFVFSWIALILFAVLAFAGCRREAPQKTDEEGHLMIEDTSKAEQNAIVLQQQMIQEMKSFDEAVERWMVEEGVQPENQAIDMAKITPRLKDRLAESLKDGRLIDPAGNPYVILTLDPGGSNVRIAVSPATAARPEFKDLNWGEYAPR